MSSIATRKTKDCSGCNACAEACPKHCIKMTFDKKGFLYPKVDTADCIDCGTCENICPFEDGNIELNPPLLLMPHGTRKRKLILPVHPAGRHMCFHLML